MDMIPVDPKLFITCRLCLEEMGQYQIVPSVQQQIKYCFDITVDPFDGLPQLICVKCKDILSNYATTKKLIIEKQNNLKQNLFLKKEALVEPQQDTVSSTQNQQDNAGQVTIAIPQNKRSLRLSSSSSESATGPSCNIVSKPRKKKKVVKAPITWESDYKKYFSCRLCNSLWVTTRSLHNHARHHQTLKTKHSNIIRQYCTVRLNKLDKKPNITGLSDLVVHNQDKITQSTPLYTIFYSKVSDSDLYKDIFNIHRDNSVTNSSTEDENIPIKRKPQRKRRLLSKSSNDTVLIETKSNRAISDEEERPKDNHERHVEHCINIDDTSDSESEVKSKDDNLTITPKKIIEAQLEDHKTIQGIISMCVHNYRKKGEDLVQQPSKESKLKHIILSIGRKVLQTKQSINCMGLLRFMEQKNLKVEWIAKKNFNKSSGSNYIRIFTKLDVHISPNDTGWVNVYPTPKQNVILNLPGNLIDTTLTESTAAASSSDMKNKLLNANPVANPKQLPKKCLQSNESRTNKTTPQQNTTLASSETVQDINIAVVPFINSQNDNDLCMPIITSTTSLAEVPCKDKKGKEAEASNPPTEGSAPNVPRIKVKPVTELLSQQGLNNFIKGQTTNFATNNLLENQVTFPQPVLVNEPLPTLSNVECVAMPPSTVLAACGSVPAYPDMPTLSTASHRVVKDNDYVILDTVELPNTRTESPFKYLKSLLQIHNLILLHPYETLSPDYACLIKFKVVFKQETINQPVVLCLSLFCLRNMFCLKVKDIDLYKISANWQWEILQIYTGEVVHKLLQNAQKVNQETYENTNNFLCLLKSIKLKK